MICAPAGFRRTAGAASSRLKAFSLLGRRCRAYARRMRVGAGMAKALQRAGQCPAPAKCGDGLQIPRRGGTLGRPFRGDLGGLSLLPVQATHTAAFSYSLRSIEITASSAPDEYAFSSTSRFSENSLESAYQDAAAKAVCSQRIFCSSSGRRDT